jgi:CheY-like chemotaxis protein
MLMRALGRLLPGCILSEASDGKAALQRVMVRCARWLCPAKCDTFPNPGYENTLGCGGVRLGDAGMNYFILRLLAPIYACICACVCLQGMSGGEVAKALRKRGYEGVLIGVTANTMSSDLASFAATGLDGMHSAHLVLLSDRLDSCSCVDKARQRAAADCCHP